MLPACIVLLMHKIPPTFHLTLDDHDRSNPERVLAQVLVHDDFLALFKFSLHDTTP